MIVAARVNMKKFLKFNLVSFGIFFSGSVKRAEPWRNPKKEQKINAVKKETIETIFISLF